MLWMNPVQSKYVKSLVWSEEYIKVVNMTAERILADNSFRQEEFKEPKSNIDFILAPYNFTNID